MFDKVKAVMAHIPVSDVEGGYVVSESTGERPSMPLKREHITTEGTLLPLGVDVGGMPFTAAERLQNPTDDVILYRVKQAIAREALSDGYTVAVM